MTAAIEATSEPAEPQPGKGRFGRRTIIIAGITLALLLAGGGTAWYLLRAPAQEAEVGDAGHDGGPAEAEASYIEVPALVVNLRSSDSAARLIKLRVMLVPRAPTDVDFITVRLPLIVDSFQPFLRELRPEDLAGSAAVFRIKEELLVRANGAVGNGKVKNVLIQDLIQQ